MARVKGALMTRKRRNKVLKAAKGYWGAKSKHFKMAKQAVMKSGNYAFVGRKLKKREFRKLWITRISAEAKNNGMNYSTFMNGLKKAGISLNRKMLSEIAINDAAGGDPNKNINIHDTPDEIKRKMKKAFCPPEKEEEDTNPILMIAKYIIFPTIGRMDINRPEKYGGPVSYDSYEALTHDYFTQVDGKALLSPMDLKDGVADGMNKCLAPVAEYFEKHPENYNAMLDVLRKLGKL